MANCSPSCLFICLTLLVTSLASGLLILSIMTDYWEYIEFDRSLVAAIAARYNDTEVRWIADRVARVQVVSVTKSHVSSTGDGSIARTRRSTDVKYLVPMYGGVWRMCTYLTDDQRQALVNVSSLNAGCTNYIDTISNDKNNWMMRMQNLSISCALVCLCLLGACTIIGLLGILKKQMSAIMVTGVMYFLAAIFCTFTLWIMHYKRRSLQICGHPDLKISNTEYYMAQVFSSGWSLILGWVGVLVCVLASSMWWFMSKILRYGPTDGFSGSPIA